MKEAAGEANMTVITIVLIAIVLAVGTIIVNNVMRNTAQSSACQSAGGTWQGGLCFRSETCNVTTGNRMDCTGGTVMDCEEDNGNWTCGGA